METDSQAPLLAQPLPWHRRLDTRVVSGVVFLVALSMGATLVETSRTVTNRSLDQATRDLDAGRSAFAQLIADRAESLSTQAALVAALPVFRAHIADARLATDVATLQAMTDGYRQQLKATFAIVTNRNGKSMAATGWPAATQAPRAVDPIVSQALSGRPSQDLLPIADRLFLIVSEPTRFSEEVLGALTVGYSLDDAFAARLAKVTHCDVNIAGNGHLYASSLPPENRAALAALVGRADWPRAQESLDVERIGSADYAVGAFPLPTTGNHQPAGRLILAQDWQSSMQLLTEMRDRVLVSGAVIFAIALAGAIFISRRMSRPLKDLADAAGDVASGNWERQLPERGSAEATMMAQAFNHMTTSLRHWFDEAKRRDDALRQAQKMEAVGRLAGGVAHDFNNLLTAINGYSELVLERFDADDPWRQDVLEVIKAADRATALTGQLLAFSRRQVVAPRVIALDRIVSDTDRMLKRLIGEDITLVTTIAPNAGYVTADPGQIQQVLMNLAVNARDAMPQGGVLYIELTKATFTEAKPHRTLPQGEYVCLSITDTGTGMSQETASHVFEPFFTTKSEGKGTGLGLAMAYGIVEQAGGAIDVDTELGRGTTFSVWLPATAEEQASETEAAERPSAAPAQAWETVLLVEDEPRVARLVAHTLRRAGYTVLEATDGQEAIELARNHSGEIDLLLTDVVMPGMNGRELADRLTDGRSTTRVLYMSGHADDAILRHGIQTNRVHFLQKPFTIEALLTKTREVLTSGSAVRPIGT